MPTKLTTPEQLDQLEEGIILTRFPAKGKPEDKFDESRKDDIDVFKILTIDRKGQIAKLILADSTIEMFTWPKDIERLNIKLSNILLEKTWWIP
jgi:hypothetical protein